MKWTVSNFEVSGGLGFVCRQEDRSLSFFEAMNLLGQNQSFRAFFIDVLAAVPWQAYRWECPPASPSLASRPFEFVVIEDLQLVRAADPSAFSNFMQAGKPAVSFENLGRDATLVVPCDLGGEVEYCHLASFVRTASMAQRQDFFKLLGNVVLQQCSERQLWLSTAGGGVPWLHARLDLRPKYYRYTPYRDER